MGGKSPAGMLYPQSGNTSLICWLLFVGCWLEPSTTNQQLTTNIHPIR